MAAMNLNHEQFDRYQNEGKLMLVDYWAPWCGYCRRIDPAFESIAENYGDRIVAAKVNIDEEGPLSDKEQVEVIPTLVVYKEGYDLGSIVAPESKARIEAFLAETL